MDNNTPSNQDVKADENATSNQDVKADSREQDTSNPQLSKEEQEQKNKQKALDESLQKLQNARDEKRQTKQEKEELDKEVERLRKEKEKLEAEMKNSQSTESSGGGDEYKEFIQSYTQSVRKEALTTFYDMFPDVANSTELQNAIFDTYNKIKSTKQEVNTNQMLEDLKRSYYANLGPKLAQQQESYNKGTTMLEIASRNGSDSSSDTSGSYSTVEVTKEEKETAERMGITQEKLAEMKKKGYL